MSIRFYTVRPFLEVVTIIRISFYPYGRSFLISAFVRSLITRCIDPTIFCSIYMYCINRNQFKDSFQSSIACYRVRTITLHYTIRPLHETIARIRSCTQIAEYITFRIITTQAFRPYITTFCCRKFNMICLTGKYLCSRMVWNAHIAKHSFIIFNIRIELQQIQTIFLSIILETCISNRICI